MKVEVLVENTSQNDLKCEHGLSFFIEFQGQSYLLDAGSTDLFMENAKVLNTPIDEVKTCILSHGHYDHSGGFASYLSENKACKVYAMENVMGEYYSGSGGMHYIGLSKELKEQYQERFVFLKDITQIAENVYVIPHSTNGLEHIGQRTQLYVKRGEAYLPDDFSHELSLVFDTENGLVVFNSCSHGGMQNIINEVKNALPKKQIYAFLGGLHMKGGHYSEEEIKSLVAFLQEEGLQYIYTGHCTGETAMQILKQYAGDMVQVLSTGIEIII